MKIFIVAVAFQGLLVLVSSHAIRNAPIPAKSTKVATSFEIYTDLSPAPRNVTQLQETIQQVDLCNCGRSTATKIVGGRTASQGEFPWRVKIEIDAPNKEGEIETGICGGTIISPRWILTAAHCLPDDATEVRVLEAGQINPTRTIAVMRYFKHEEFEIPLEALNDIALVELQQDLDFSNPIIAPACLPYQLAGQTERTATVVASGWGKMSQEANKDSKTLRKVTLDVIGNELCQKMHTDRDDTPDNEKKHYNFLNTEFIMPTQMCTHTAYKDVCQGDSGGSIDELIDGKWHAVGVVSYGHGCADPIEAGVYTRVSEFTSWIEQNTGIQNFCKP